jgi:hypothetical protein
MMPALRDSLLSRHVSDRATDRKPRDGARQKAADRADQFEREKCLVREFFLGSLFSVCDSGVLPIV